MSFPKPFYRWRPHPWHGLEIGPKPPEVVHAYIEITPFDLVKCGIQVTNNYLQSNMTSLQTAYLQLSQI